MKVELQDIYKLSNMLYHLCEQYEKENGGIIGGIGARAFSLLTDYPLYASSSNISYAEAIAVASVLFGDIDREYERQEKQGEDFDKCAKAYKKYLDEFDTAKGEPVCFSEFYNNEWQGLKGGENE